MGQVYRTMSWKKTASVRIASQSNARAATVETDCLGSPLRQKQPRPSLGDIERATEMHVCNRFLVMASANATDDILQNFIWKSTFAVFFI